MKLRHFRWQPMLLLLPFALMSATEPVFAQSAGSVAEILKAGTQSTAAHMSGRTLEGRWSDCRRRSR